MRGSLKNISKFFVIFFFVFAIYALFAPKYYQIRHYFVPLADSILHGRIDIAPNGTVLNELVPVDGKYFVVYPPAPAILALPFVGLLGPKVNQVWIEIFYASAAIAFFYFLTEKFFKECWIRIALTVILAFGTNYFYTALEGTSWFFSHISVVFFLVLALLAAVKKKPLLAGMLFVGVFLSRLPAGLTFPAVLYLLFQGESKKLYLKNLILFFAPVVLGSALFTLYNFARFGSIFQTGYSLIPGVLQESWFQNGIFSVLYIPRNLWYMFLQMPKIIGHFPYFLPDQIGMAIWLTTPALLLIFFARSKNRIVLWFILASILAAIPSLVHGTPGFSQFGVRFLLDYIVLLVLILGFAYRRLGPTIVAPFVGVSLLINFWAVILHYSLGLF